MKILFRNRETLGGALFVLLGAYLLYEISTFAVAAEKIRSLGPQFFPDILAWGMTLLSITLFCQGLRLPPAPIIPVAYRGIVALRPLAFLVAAGSYIFLSNALGFVIWSLLFLSALQYALGERDAVRNMTLSVLITGMLYALFAWALNVPLPRGPLPF